MDNNIQRAISLSSSSSHRHQHQQRLHRATPPTEPEQQQQETIVSECCAVAAHKPNPIAPPSPLASAASISLALGSILSSNILLSKTVVLPSPPPKLLTARLGTAKSSRPSPLPAPKKRTGPVPTQASTALQIPAPPPATSHSKAAGVSVFPDYHRLRQLGREAGDPSNAAALRKAAIVWFRNDLRIHDNEALSTANREALSVLPVYCFDPRDYGKSSSGFDKTGPFRATFLLECVANLRDNLRERGSDLVVRIGRPEEVLVELAKSIGADALYAHQEVSHEEITAEEKIKSSLEEEGVETKFFWGSTLYHPEDLPFKVEDMPSNYGGFRERVQKLSVRQIIKDPEQLKGLPTRGDVEPGKIPSLLDLGLNPNFGQDGKTTANASLKGGESEALQRVKGFAVECREQPNKLGKDGSGESIYGANFSCKISPWLTMGCLSPRYMFEELKKSEKTSISSSLGKNSGADSGQGGLNWLKFELLWRDFFRFITKKYGSANKRQDASPATACTGALAV